MRNSSIAEMYIHMKRLSVLGQLSTFLLLHVFAQPLPQPTEHFGRDRTYDVLHYKLDLRIDEHAKTVVGDVSITLVPLRPELTELILDAADLNISQATLGKSRLKFSVENEQLRLFLDKPVRLTDTLTLTVSYSASPKKGLYFIQPDSAYPNRPWQVWSQGENEDNHFWFPCYDYPNDKAASEMIVTVNDRFTAISNGALIKVTQHPKNHTKTFHWSESKPHVSYLISLIVGEYVELKDSWDGIPISYYVYPEDKDIAKFSFSKTPTMVKVFSEKIGFRYPWEKYAQTVVVDFVYGGMENVSATTLTDYTIHDQRAHLDVSSDGLVAHELAHQWWGDLLTCRDWSQSWLNEGFATYFEHVFQEADSGWDYAAYKILANQNDIVAKDVGSNRRPTVTNRFVASEDIFDNRIYGKGGCVLHMLRFVLGDDLFWKAIRHYVNKHAFQNVETNDFKIAIEEATGYNLHWFFRQWIYQAGYPEFVVTTKWDAEKRSLKMNVKQVQKLEEYVGRDSLGGIFTTPVDVEIWDGGKSRTERIVVSKAEQEFTFSVSEQPQLVLFDKGNWILKKVQFQKSADEWIFQLEHTGGIDRVLAARELKAFVDQPKVIEALHRALLSDNFWPVRVEAVHSLAESKEQSTADLLIDGYRDGHARVRVAVISALGKFLGPHVVAVLRRAFESDVSDSVAGVALRSLASTDSANVRNYCMEGLQRASHHEVIRIAALKLIADFGDEEALKILKDYTRYGVYRDLRIEAVRSLSRVWEIVDSVAEFILAFIDDPSFHVRHAVIEALGRMHSTKAIEPLRRHAFEEPEARLRKAAREAITKIQQSQVSTSH